PAVARKLSGEEKLLAPVAKYRNGAAAVTSFTSMSPQPLHFGILRLVLVAFLLRSVYAQLPAPANHQKPDPVVITVADRKITVSELCSAIGSLPPPQRKGYVLHPALAKDW